MENQQNRWDEDKSEERTREVILWTFIQMAPIQPAYGLMPSGFKPIEEWRLDKENKDKGEFVSRNLTYSTPSTKD